MPERLRSAPSHTSHPAVLAAGRVASHAPCLGSRPDTSLQPEGQRNWALGWGGLGARAAQKVGLPRRTHAATAS